MDTQAEEDSSRNLEARKKGIRRSSSAMMALVLVVLYFISVENMSLAGLVFIFVILTYMYGIIRYGDMTVGEAWGLKEVTPPDSEGSIKITGGANPLGRNKGLKPSTDSDRIEEKELRKQVLDREAEGWTIDEIDNSNDRVIMKSTKGGSIGGHALTGFLTGLWTLGGGNVVYDELSKKRNEERIVVRIDDDSTDESDESQKHYDAVELIKELKQLHDEGAISDEEYKNKKEELMEKI